MNKPRVHFDIDKTMLDTKKMLENIQASLKSAGIAATVFESTINAYLSSLVSKTFFDPEEVIQLLLIESKNIDETAVRSAFWQAENFSNALFPEVGEVLSTLSDKVELGTFSQGVLEWQLKKLQLSGVAEFFPEELRIIEENKLSETVISNIAQNSWVVDDKEEVVQHLRRARQDTTVLWINRDTADNTDPGTIKSLQEIVTLLKI